LFAIPNSSDIIDANCEPVSTAILVQMDKADLNQIVVLVWLASLAWVLLTAWLDNLRSWQFEFSDRDPPATSDGPLTLRLQLTAAGFMYLVVAAIWTGLGLFLLALFDLEWPRDWVFDLMIKVSAPVAGVVASSPMTSSAPWLRPVVLTLVVAVPIAVIGSFFPAVQATTFWWIKVQSPKVDAVNLPEFTVPYDYTQFLGRLESYAETWPEGPQIQQVESLIDELRWRPIRWRLANASEDVRREDTVELILRYVTDLPKPSHEQEALKQIEQTDLDTVFSYMRLSKSHEMRMKLEERVWQLLSSADTVRSLLTYNGHYPNGHHVSASERRIAELRRDVSIWQRAAQSSSVSAVDEFLRNYPGHKNTPDAEKRLSGYPFRDLVRNRQIEFRLHGCGIRTVCGQMRRKTVFPLVVKVPAGLMFESSNPGFQSMAIVQDHRIKLPSRDWASVTLSAACADIELAVPTNKIQFTFYPSGQDKTLLSLNAALNSDQATYPIRQALIWIVRNDAGVCDLRYRQFASVAGSPALYSVIKPKHISAALGILKSSGYPVELTRAANEDPVSADCTSN